MQLGFSCLLEWKFAEILLCWINSHLMIWKCSPWHKKRSHYYGLYDMVKAVSHCWEKLLSSMNLPEAIVKALYKAFHILFFISIHQRNKGQNKNVKVLHQKQLWIKAYLNRINDNELKLKLWSTKKTEIKGYLAAELFATLEYLQRKKQRFEFDSRRIPDSLYEPASAFYQLSFLRYYLRVFRASCRKIG